MRLFIFFNGFEGNRIRRIHLAITMILIYILLKYRDHDSIERLRILAVELQWKSF